MENLGEAGSLEPTVPRQEASLQLQAAGGPPTGQRTDLSSCIYTQISTLMLDELLFLSYKRHFFNGSGDVGRPTVNRDEEEEEPLETMKFNFNIESLGLVLYSNDPKQVSQHTRTAADGFYLHSRIRLSSAVFTDEVRTMC